MSTTGLIWLRELLWWLFTALFTLAVMLPLSGSIQTEYLSYNVLFIVLSVTLFRFSVFLHSTPYLKSIWVRFVLVFIAAVAFFQFLRVIQDFLYTIDNYTISAFLTPEKMFEHSDELQRVYRYFKREFIVFSTATQMLIVVFGLRVIGSVWHLGKKH